MTDVHTDGNGVAGLLEEVLAVEVTTMQRRCHVVRRRERDGRAPRLPRRRRRAALPELRRRRRPRRRARGRLVVEWRGTFTAPRPA